MDSNDDGRGRGRRARLLLAVALAAVAVRSVLNGKRVKGALAGAGAVVLGYDAAGDVAAVADRDRKLIDIETGDESDGAEAGATGTGDDAELRCGICGEPIVPGQRRGPGPDDRIVHDACEETLA